MGDENFTGIVKAIWHLEIDGQRYEVVQSGQNYDLFKYMGQAISVTGTLQDGKIEAKTIALPTKPEPPAANCRKGTTLKPTDGKNSVSWKGKWSFVYAIEPPQDDSPPWNPPMQRHPDNIKRIIDFLDVEHTRRYEPRAEWTCCTIYVSDFTRLMYCEIPLDPTGPQKWYNRAANQMIRWIDRNGLAAGGWSEVKNASEAQDRANKGFPVVGLWGSGDQTPGHVFMVIPGELDADGVPHVAQAGAKNFSSGRWTRDGVRYITHA